MNQIHHGSKDKAATMETCVTLVNKIDPRSMKTLVILVTKPENKGNAIHHANNCNKSDQIHHMNTGKCNYGTISSQIGQIFLVDIYLRDFFLVQFETKRLCVYL